LAVEAYLLRGEALSQTGDWQPAARAYLEAFSLAPNGTRAPGALVSLGKSLGQLGQTSEACLTLTEVGVRFPGAPEIATAQAEQAALGC
jgi:TolA-binding protein